VPLTFNCHHVRLELRPTIAYVSPRLTFSRICPVAALGALRIIRSEGPALFERLLDNAAYLRRGFRELGLKVVEPGTLPDGSEATTPVVPVMVGEDWQAVLLWKALFDAGVYTNVAIHPAVPPGGALLRTSLMATHRREQLDRALEIFSEVTSRFPDLPRT
jgi:8-amino-7-oxononanoate synthase